MMRSLLLCLLLLLPVAVVAESSGDGLGYDDDDEDFSRSTVRVPKAGRTREVVEEASDQVTIIVVAVVAVVALLVIIVIAMFSQKLCRCNQPRSYAIPEEQNKKGAV